MRPIPDGTVARVRLDRGAANVSPPVVSGARRAGRKVLRAVKDMGGRGQAAWRAVLDDPVARGPRAPEFSTVDAAAGLDRAPAAPWPEVAARRRTVHERRDLLAHAPDAPHDEVSADDADVIHAESAKGWGPGAGRSRASGGRSARPWRPAWKRPETACSPSFAFARLPPSRWDSARATHAIERLHEGFERRIKPRTVPPSAESAAMLSRALPASGRITTREVDGWQTPAEKPAAAVPLDRVA